MRLSQADITCIRNSVEAHFGAGSAVWLFGSRLDDAARGGDIDLYVDPAGPLPEDLFLARQAARMELEHRLRRPVDLLVRRNAPTAFMRQAKAEGRRL
jgi:predicted nucleotidyltransferase